MGFQMFTFDSDYIESPILYTENCSLLKSNINMSYDRVYFTRTLQANIHVDILVIEITQEDLLKHITLEYSNSYCRSVLFTSTPLKSFDFFISIKHKYSWVYMEDERILHHSKELTNKYNSITDENHHQEYQDSSVQIYDIFTPHYSIPDAENCYAIGYKKNYKQKNNSKIISKIDDSRPLFIIKDCLFKFNDSSNSNYGIHDKDLSSISNRKALIHLENNSNRSHLNERYRTNQLSKYRDSKNRVYEDYLFNSNLRYCKYISSLIPVAFNVCSYSSNLICNNAYIDVNKRKDCHGYLPEIRSILHREGVPWKRVIERDKRSLSDLNDCLRTMKRIKHNQKQYHGSYPEIVNHNSVYDLYLLKMFPNIYDLRPCQIRLLQNMLKYLSKAQKTSANSTPLRSKSLTNGSKIIDNFVNQRVIKMNYIDMSSESTMIPKKISESRYSYESNIEMKMMNEDFTISRLNSFEHLNDSSISYDKEFAPKSKRRAYDSDTFKRHCQNKKIEIQDEHRNMNSRVNLKSVNANPSNTVDSYEGISSFLTERVTKVKALPRHEISGNSPQSQSWDSDSFEHFDDSACSLIMQTGYCVYSESNIVYGFNRINRRVNAVGYSHRKAHLVKPIKLKKGKSKEKSLDLNNL